MTVNTQELREAAEAFKQACDEGLFETEFGTWQALSHEFDQQVSHTVVIALLDEIDALRAALHTLICEVVGLVEESEGVYGLHLNGDPSPWEELLPGGRFERLTSLHDAEALIAPPQGESA